MTQPQGRDKKTESKKNPKRGAPKDDDDSSVDEHGNIRGLIDYDYESEDESMSDLTESELKALKKHGKIPERLKGRKPREVCDF